MKFKTTIKGLMFLLGFGLCFSSCTKNTTGAGSSTSSSTVGKFFVATTTEGTGSIVFNTSSLDSTDTVTTVGNGVALSIQYTNWIVNPTYNIVFGLYYAGGQPGQGISYKLDDSGNIVKSGADVQISDRFTTYGPFGKYIVTGVNSGDTASIFNFINVSNNNAITRKVYTTNNYFGVSGHYAMFSGICDRGNGEFLSGLILVDSTSGSAVYPDSCYVAAFDSSMNLLRIYRDGRQSYSTGRYRSQYYSQMALDDNNNCYVFSGSYDANTTKDASALLIKSGATSFDASYYYDIQSASGGYRFRKVWHLTGDYFMVEFYNTTGTVSAVTAATQYAILNMSTKTFKWISGFPSMSSISSVGWPTAYNGKAYVPVNTTTDLPTVYVIDPSTAVASKGLVVNAASITALATF